MRRTCRHLVVAKMVGLLVFGCAAPVPAPSTSVPSPSNASPSDPTGRRSDLAYLVERLEVLHPNPFLEEGADAFLDRVASIEARADTLTDAEFLVALMDLMGHRERDGHSGAWALAQTGERLHAWPVWLWDFPDGLRIVAAAEDRDLIGARLIGVGGVDVGEAWAAVEPLVPRDNALSLRANLPMHLTLPEVLEVLGLRGPGDPGLTFELADGSTRELTTEPLPIEAFRGQLPGSPSSWPMVRPGS